MIASYLAASSRNAYPSKFSPLSATNHWPGTMKRLSEMEGIPRECQLGGAFLVRAMMREGRKKFAPTCPCRCSLALLPALMSLPKPGQSAQR